MKVAMVPANTIAEELGDKRMTNMVLLGALLANLDILQVEAVEKALKEHLPERHQKLLSMNKEAMQRGGTYVAAAISA
jgi:2-oxoglutarate ferredoxin oxidoreductase subunit gamma